MGFPHTEAQTREARPCGEGMSLADPTTRGSGRRTRPRDRRILICCCVASPAPGCAPAPIFEGCAGCSPASAPDGPCPALGDVGERHRRAHPPPRAAHGPSRAKGGDGTTPRTPPDPRAPSPHRATSDPGKGVGLGGAGGGARRAPSCSRSGTPNRSVGGRTEPGV